MNFEFAKEMANPPGPTGGRMNGLRQPRTAPAGFAARQAEGDSLKCCRSFFDAARQ